MSLFLAISALVVSTVTLAYTGRQSSAAQRQAASADQQTIVIREQLELAERVRREQVQPYVVVALRPRAPESQVLVLAVTNVGPTMAHDISIEVDPPLRSSHGSKFEENLKTAMARKIPVLPPGQVLTWFMDTGPGLDRNPELPKEYSFTVRASGPFGPMEPLTYLVDLAVLEGTDLNSESVEGRLNEITKNLKELTSAANDLTRIIASFKQDEPPTQ